MNPNSTAKEQSLNPKAVSHPPKPKATEPSHELDERIVISLQAAGDKKALDPVVLDLLPLMLRKADSLPAFTRLSQLPEC